MSAAGAEVEKMREKLVRELFVSLFALALAPVQALAQGNIALFQLGGTETVVQVINATDDAPVLADLGEKKMWAPRKGSKVGRRFGYGTMGNTAVEVSVCSETPTYQFFNPPPAWATDPEVVGPAVLPLNYSNPSKAELRKRVEKIKAALRDRVGGKDMSREIAGWQKQVEREGFGFTAQSCENPTILVRGADVSQWGYGHTITFIAAGSREKGYRLEQATY